MSKSWRKVVNWWVTPWATTSPPSCRRLGPGVSETVTDFILNGGAQIRLGSWGATSWQLGTRTDTYITSVQSRSSPLRGGALFTSSPSAPSSLWQAGPVPSFNSHFPIELQALFILHTHTIMPSSTPEDPTKYCCVCIPVRHVFLVAAVLALLLSSVLGALGILALEKISEQQQSSLPLVPLPPCPNQVRL